MSSAYNRVLFTKDMKKDYTLLCPQMSPIHFDLIEPAIRSFGYKLEVLQKRQPQRHRCGLKIREQRRLLPRPSSVIGQIMDALLSGKYDLDAHGGDHEPDRRRAAGLPTTSDLSAGPAGEGRHAPDPGDLRQRQRHGDQPRLLHHPLLLTKALQAVVYGDVFMRVLYATRPYEEGGRLRRRPPREVEGALRPLPLQAEPGP